MRWVGLWLVAMGTPLNVSQLVCAEETAGPHDEQLMPLKIRQPAGFSFVIRGNEVLQI